MTSSSTSKSHWRTSTASTASGTHHISLLFLNMTLPMCDHVITITKALLAEVAYECTISVLERRSLTRSSHHATHHHACSASSILCLPQSALSLFPLFLGHKDALLLLSHSAHFFLSLLFLIFIRICYTVSCLEMIKKFSFIPVAGKAHPTCQSIVLIIQYL